MRAIFCGKRVRVGTHITAGMNPLRAQAGRPPKCKCLMSASEMRWRDMSYRGNTFNVRTSRERIERIHVSGNRYGPVQLLLDRSAEGLRRRRVAVHQIKLLWRRGEA